MPLFSFLSCSIFSKAAFLFASNSLCVFVTIVVAFKDLISSGDMEACQYDENPFAGIGVLGMDLQLCPLT